MCDDILTLLLLRPILDQSYAGTRLAGEGFTEAFTSVDHALSARVELRHAGGAAGESLL